MTKIYSPFASHIYHTDARVSNHDEIHQWILKLYADSPVAHEGNFYGKGFTSYFYDDFSSHLNELDIFKELRDSILDHAAMYIDHQTAHMAQHRVLARRRPLKIVSMWFNVNPPGGYQGRHHHAGNLLGGTYYIDVPPESGRIGFTDPNPFAYIMNQRHCSETLTIADFKIETLGGEMLIWPGWMDHEISANKTVDSKRITVSFAIDWVE